MNTKMFYKYKSLDGDIQDNKSSYFRTYDCLEKCYFFYSRQNQLNDPFDMFTIIDDIPTDGLIRKYLKDNKLLSPSNTVDMLKKKLQMYHCSTDERINDVYLNQFTHVLSLTPDVCNDVMWGIYASNYSGIAIGYETRIIYNKFCLECDNDKNREINQRVLTNYLNTMKTKYLPEEPEFHLRLLPVVYTDEEKKHFSFTKMNFDVFTENMYQKKTKWSYEQEYRSVIASAEYVNKNLLYYYKKSIVKQIVFGYKCDKDKQLNLISMMKRIYGDNIDYFVAKPDFTTNTVSLAKLEN